MSIHDPGCSLPRYSTGGAVGGGAGVVGAGHAFSTTGGQIITGTAEATGAGGGWGVDAQPAATIAANAQQGPAIDDNGRMAWVFLEIFIALAIAVAIVWWTMPRRPKRGDDRKDER